MDKKTPKRATPAKKTFDFMVEPAKPVEKKSAEKQSLYDPRLLVRSDSMAPWKQYHFFVSAECRTLVEAEYGRANGSAYSSKPRGERLPGQVVSLGGILSKAIELKAGAVALKDLEGGGKKVLLAANLDPKLAARLMREAKLAGVTASVAVESFIRAFLPFKNKRY